MSAIFDPSPGLHPGPIGPATRHAVIVPADNADLPLMARRIYVGTAGDLALVSRDQPRNADGSYTAVVYKNAPVGFMDVWARQVFATGTTASNLIALA